MWCCACVARSVTAGAPGSRCSHRHSLLSPWLNVESSPPFSASNLALPALVIPTPTDSCCLSSTGPVLNDAKASDNGIWFQPLGVASECGCASRCLLCRRCDGSASRSSRPSLRSSPAVPRECHGVRALRTRRVPPSSIQIDTHSQCWCRSQGGTWMQLDDVGLRDSRTISSLPFVQELPAHQRSELFFQLARLRLFGDGALAPNVSVALPLLHASAGSFGHPAAQFFLGALAAQGISSNDGGEAATAPSVLYHHFAARSGSVASSMALGYLSLHGYGVPKSCENALRHYKFAADRVVQAQAATRPIHIFSAPAPVRLSDNADKRHRPAHAGDAAQRVEYLRSRAAGSTDPLLLEKAASVVLFSDLLHAAAMDEEHDRALEATALLKRAVGLGSFSAKALLGHVYAYGIGGTRRDVSEALRLYQEALNESAVANTTSAEAANGLGLIYFHGAEGTSIDYERAMQLFKLSARSGHVDGVYNAGVLLSQSHPQRSREYLGAAAQVGHLKAQFELARLAEKERFRGAKSSRAAAASSSSDSQSACEAIVKRYKTVAESSDEGVELLQRAAEAFFFANDSEHALRLYLLAAEMGYEIAESNAAWLIERRHHRFAAQSASSSKLYHKLVLRGVAQDSADAYVRYGDLLFRDGDVVLAMFQYELADFVSHGKHGQALYSIGYMHEHGLGVSEQSREKAALYYELAGTAEPALKHVMRLLQLKLRFQAFASTSMEPTAGCWGSALRWFMGDSAGPRKAEQADSALEPASSFTDSSTLSPSREAGLPLKAQGESSVQERVAFVSALRFTRDSRLRVKAPELPASQPLTVETWINIERQDKSVTNMVLLDFQDTLQLELARYKPTHGSQGGDGVWRLQVRTISALFVFAKAPFAESEWHHLAVAIAPEASSAASALSISLFVDGELKQRLDLHGHHRGTSAGPAQVLSIGSSLMRSATSTPSSAATFTGSLMHMRIWSAAISSSSSVRLLMAAQQHEVLGSDKLAFEIHFDVRRGRSETRVPLGDTLERTASLLVASSDIFSTTAVYPEMVPFPPQLGRGTKHNIDDAPSK
ncbi:hypothetical protein PybrP1_002744 [[Pythium] brassicae (nom. inval.)]|nr:hypothetical protein PybrP1_002744 [[Pythium] brassicae (nom. inval.)]